MIRHLSRLITALDGILPAQCPICRAWPAKRTMILAPHRTAGWIRICPTCYRTLYPDRKERTP